MHYLKALRAYQWVKNLLVFVPVLASHQLSLQVLLQSAVAFVSFNLIASSAYVLNDLRDIEADRLNPRKKHRPFASGSLPAARGPWLAALLFALGLAAAVPLGWLFVSVVVIYFAGTTVYTTYLKNFVIVDIVALATFYTLRLIAGGIAADIPLSVWLLAFSIFFFFALAAVKRQAELYDAAGRGELNASGRSYRVGDLPMVTQMATASGYVSVLVMALYINSPEVQLLYAEPAMLWGICPVLLFWISRMVMVTHRGDMYDDPVLFAVKDRASRISFLLIAAFAVGGTLL